MVVPTGYIVVEQLASGCEMNGYRIHLEGKEFQKYDAYHGRYHFLKPGEQVVVRELVCRGSMVVYKIITNANGQPDIRPYESWV